MSNSKLEYLIERFVPNTQQILSSNEIITNINNKFKTKKQNYGLFKFRFRKHYGEFF